MIVKADCQSERLWRHPSPLSTCEFFFSMKTKHSSTSLYRTKRSKTVKSSKPSGMVQNWEEIRKTSQSAAYTQLQRTPKSELSNESPIISRFGGLPEEEDQFRE